ncbi:hypothetical protein C8R45DRAFT_477757 [Mycena sanguinolenta]|nr:hypothetical protein C8R45DRAFT_477757 [Mycena sanguinolenta]
MSIQSDLDDRRLAPELGHQIFEIAALARPRQIPTLMLLARRVKIRVEPLLHRVVSLASAFLSYLPCGRTGAKSSRIPSVKSWLLVVESKNSSPSHIYGVRPQFCGVVTRCLRPPAPRNPALLVPPHPSLRLHRVIVQQRRLPKEDPEFTIKAQQSSVHLL